MFIQCHTCYRIHREDCDYTHCDCQMAIDENCFPIGCAACNQTLSLDDGCEWPEQRLYCWSCAHEKLAAAEELLRRIDNAYDKPSWVDRETANTVMDAINDYCGDNGVLAT